MATNSQIDSSSETIIFFDGICNLCNGSVQFIIKKDKKGYFKFASLQSDIASAYLPQLGIDPDEMESILLLENGQLHRRSNAALNISRHLSGLWSLIYLLKIIPRPLRDIIYNWIAKNRYKWFGKRDECMIPSPELSSRFIEA